MKSLPLKSQLFNFPNLTKSQLYPSFLVPTVISCKVKKIPAKSTCVPRKSARNTGTPKSKDLISENFDHEWSRNLIVGGVSVGILVVLMGMDEQRKALALGPEGPLMEEFWDNMRRYGLYILTVSTGVLYAVFQPIVELLKNPISAILILTILGGGVFIVSQVVSAMVGVSEFNYDYNY